jgi:hypothetical protein
MKELLVGLLALGSFSVFAKEYVYFQTGITNKTVVSVFSHCSSNVNQFMKWHKQLDQLEVFDVPTAKDSIVFESPEECRDFVYNAILDKEAVVLEGISVKGKTKGRKIIHTTIGALEIKGSIKY